MSDHRAVRVAFALGALIGLAVTWSVAWAAKVTVTVTTATSNTDGTSIASISRVRLTWGPCVAGAKSGDPATSQASVQSQSIVLTTGAQALPGAKVTVQAFPVGLAPVCFLAFNSDAGGTESGPTNVLVYSPIQSTGQPVTLGQPIQLPASSQSSSAQSSSSQNSSTSTSAH